MAVKTRKKLHLTIKVNCLFPLYISTLRHEEVNKGGELLGSGFRYTKSYKFILISLELLRIIFIIL